MTADKSAEDEALAQVFSNDRDRGDNSAPPEVNKVPEPTVPEPQVQETAPPAPSEPVDPNANRHVPLSELLGEREKRKGEAKLREEAETRARFYQEQFERQTTQRSQPQPQRQPPPPPPDPLLDPQGAFSHLSNDLDRKILNQELNWSERMARRTYGTELVEAAYRAVEQAGPALARQFLNHPDAYDGMVQWYKRQQVLERVGPDPEAYEKQIEERVRQKVLAELQQGRGNGAAPTRFPGTLADATQAGNSNGAHLSEEAAIGSLFASNRNRKQG